MSFPVSLCFPPPPAVPPNVLRPFRDRPRGLWKARVTSGRISTPNIPDRKEKSPHPISDTDDEPCSTPSSTLSPRPCKKPRTDDSSDSESSPQDTFFLAYTYRESGWQSHSCARSMDTSSTARASTSLDDNTTCDYDDWEDLKELFARATEQYEGNDSAEVLPLLRGVIHECHRFLHVHPDPSVLFVDPTPPDTARSDGKSRQGSSEPSSSATLSESSSRPRQKSLLLSKFELPTAFHAILGTSLFLFGNLIAQEPSLALEGEPTNPALYWLTALDVFETGENLPSRTSGIGYPDYPEDWRMAIIWGRTLVCLADDLANRQIQARKAGEDPHGVYLDMEEPKWPHGSPFQVIAAQRHPITQRMSFVAAAPNDLLVLAADQFSRGIFHMPHERRSPSLPLIGSPSAATSELGWASSRSQSSSASESPMLLTLPEMDDQFSRARELHSIASEVLLVAEKLDTPSERYHWANWADSVFSQMKMESGKDAWGAFVLRSRGRCRLIAGAAFVEEMEAALERGEMDVLRSEEATDAREDLSMAIDFFERAKVNEAEEVHGRASETTTVDADSRELRLLLTEAIVTLANLTEDTNSREALYARAKTEAGSSIHLDFDDADDDEDRMDESH